jgi:superfamily II DNA or RNA helicase
MTNDGALCAPATEIAPPPGIERREYQVEAVAASFAAWDEGVPSALVVMPTGTGKTVVAAMAVAHELARTGRRSLFIAHRKELVNQAVRTFQKFGLVTAVDMAGQREKQFMSVVGTPDVTVATVQSLQGDRLLEKSPDSYGLIIVDEAHRSHAANHRCVIDWFAGNKLGITATPDRTDGRNLGVIYEKLTYHYKMRRAIADGCLVPIKTRRVLTQVDLREIRTVGKDFSASDLAARITPAIEGLCFNIASNIGHRQTVVFTPDVGSARNVASMLSQMGVPSRAVAGTGGKNGMPEKERAANIAAFEKNEYQVITCCDLLSEGYDCRQISCVVIAKPTLARWKYVQMVGRGTRICPEQGKTDLLVLDLDWQTDASSRDLCVPFMLFDDETDRFSMDLFKRRWADRKKSCMDKDDLDLLALLKDCEKKTENGTRVVVGYTGKFAEKWATVETDAIGVGKVINVKFKKRADFDTSRVPPATEAQVDALRRYGVKEGATLTKWGAGKLLTALARRHKHGQASYQQVHRLLIEGVNEEQARDLSRADASRVIADHLVEKETVAKTQKEMFT